MGVFKYDSNGESGAQTDDPGPDSDGDPDVKTVTAVEVPNGSGYSRITATIPSDFAQELEIEGGDTLIMTQSDDGIQVTTP